MSKKNIELMFSRGGQSFILMKVRRSAYAARHQMVNTLCGVSVGDWHVYAEELSLILLDIRYISVAPEVECWNLVCSVVITTGSWVRIRREQVFWAYTLDW